jgi:DNA-binding phage protein
MSKHENMKKITAETGSKWLEEAALRSANRGARRNARRVALRVLERMKEIGINQSQLAERLEVSRQQVSKIVKGQENFTFETIDKLEKALGIRLILVETGEKEIKISDYQWTTSVIVPSHDLLSGVWAMTGCPDIVHFRSVTADDFPLTPIVSREPIRSIIGKVRGCKYIFPDLRSAYTASLQALTARISSTEGSSLPYRIQENEIFFS